MNYTTHPISILFVVHKGQVVAGMHERSALPCVPEVSVSACYALALLLSMSSYVDTFDQAFSANSRQTAQHMLPMF